MIYPEFTASEPVSGGWSGDKKYRVTASDGSVYLLRISPPEKYERRCACFEMMQRAAALGIPMCQPVEMGICDEGVYLLQSWIDGTDAEQAVAQMTADEQYSCGLNAGRIAAKLHSLPAPDTLEDWAVRFNRKIDRKLAMYGDCPLKYSGDDAFISFIAENRHLLAGRPQCWQHGDYHIGNMVISHSGRLSIIDFDRDDYGDPWEEFNRIVWSAQSLPDFSSGMIDGYFGGSVPMDFWRLLALYISCNALSSLPWAIPFGQGEIDTMLAQAQNILHWYDNMRTPVPSWYLKR